MTREAQTSASFDLTAAFRAEAAGLLGFFIRRDVPIEDAADLVSETFLAAWKTSGRRTVEPHMLRAWLYGIARNILSQHRRGGVRRSALAKRLRSTLDGGHSHAAIQADSTNESLAEHVRELIAQLPEIDREIVRLVYWEEFTQEEVASILKKPATTIRTRLSRARGVLRAQLQDGDDLH
ncbi:RNA polymerase sigma factor [Humidisolicoccus flavus]|uniref:RNA polymerase sigma factor n=1 Tax=Humidisolicoccus flavus TaxID=3111414 RepID=UPI00324C38CC